MNSRHEQQNEQTNEHPPVRTGPGGDYHEDMEITPGITTGDFILMMSLSAILWVAVLVASSCR